MTKRGTIACFGELLLRMTSPGRERFMQTPRFEVFVGGAEANVGASLAQFGHDARMVSTVADNPLGEAALGELRRLGMDVSRVAKAPGRMGMYFLSQGAVRRPSEIIYDRKHSAFDLAAPDALDWRVSLAGAQWLHLSGVTPAIGPNASAAVLAIAKAAVEMGVRVSFDGNYRGQLWAAWDGDGPGVLRQLLDCADIAFINERDIGLILGQTFTGDVSEQRKAAFDLAFSTFPRLGRIACTTRRQNSVEHHILSGELVTRDSRVESQEQDLAGVVDRIGGGDAFAAGVLHALLSDRDDQYAIDFGVAAAAIKHSIPGDINRATVADVEQAMSGDSLDVKR